MRDECLVCCFQTPLASAATVRLAPNDAVLMYNQGLDLFQARVTFSFMDDSQEGNYSCQRISEPTMSSFVYLAVTAAAGKMLHVSWLMAFNKKNCSIY